MTSEPERIAAGLTEDHLYHLMRHLHGPCEWPLRSWSDAGRHLRDIGLIEFVTDPRSSKTVSTPLGLAILKGTER